MSFVNTTAAETMEDDMMFTMEEEGSAKRPPVQQKNPNQRSYSLSDANASEDDDDEYHKHFFCPILDDSSVEICHYLKNLVYSKQLSNSPETTFMFKVSLCNNGKYQKKKERKKMFKQVLGNSERSIKNSVYLACCVHASW